MTWLRRYKIRSFLTNSLWFLPLTGAVTAALFHRLVWTIDLRMHWSLLGFTPDGARAMVGAMSSSLLGFIVFLVTMIFVAVQLAVGQLTPRIIAVVFRLRIVKIPLALFIFTYVYSLGELGRIGEPVPQFAVMLTIIFTVTSIGVFLFLIDALGRWLRPIKVFAAVAEEGMNCIEYVYPQFVEAKPESSETSKVPGKGGGLPREISYRGKAGNFLAFDARGIAAAASRAGGLIKIVPQVGDFIVDGDPLLRISGGREDIDEGDLRQRVAVGPERTMEQDPAFAFRIIVDITIKALSPSINDPTTAISGIDQIHRLLRKVGLRDMSDGRIYDESGQLRLVFPTPNWEDFVRLGVSEIRQYGAGSIQIVRRLRAMLDHLMRTLPPHCIPPLREQLKILDHTVARSFPDPEDRATAGLGDYQGIGGVRSEQEDSSREKNPQEDVL